MDFLRNIRNYLSSFAKGRKRTASHTHPEVNITGDQENFELQGPSRKRMKPSCPPCGSGSYGKPVDDSDPVIIFESPRKGQLPMKRPTVASMNVQRKMPLHRSFVSSTSGSRSAESAAVVPFLKPSLKRPMKQKASERMPSPLTPRNFNMSRNEMHFVHRRDSVRLHEKQEFITLLNRTRRAMDCGSLIIDKVRRTRALVSGSRYQNFTTPVVYNKKEDIVFIDLSKDEPNERPETPTGAEASILPFPTPSSRRSSVPFTSTPAHSTASTAVVARTPKVSKPVEDLGEYIRQVLDTSLGTIQNPISIDDDAEPQGKSDEDKQLAVFDESLARRSTGSHLDLSFRDCEYAKREWLEQSIRETAISNRERTAEIDKAQQTLSILQNESTLTRDIEDRIRRNLTLTDIITLELPEEEKALPEITDEMLEIIENARAHGVGSQEIVCRTQNNVSVTRSDVKSLAPLQWLNDNVIDAYMDLIVRRSKVQEGWPTAYAFTTFFYPKLCNEGYSNTLKRWTRKVDIFSYDLLIFPIHLGIHWCLAVADTRRKTIEYFDSLGGKNYKCCKTLLNYLSKEHAERKKAPFDADSWDIDVKDDIPQQQNGSDCGMFACKFAEYLSRDAKITFDQEHMNYFRERMIYEIVSQTILHP